MFASWRGAGALRDLLFGRWLLLALIALVALGGVAVACGDDDDDDAAVAAEQVVEEQAAAQVEEQEALKIGFLADFSGPLAEFGPVTQTGVQLAIDHINAAGGIFGQDIILVTGDTQVDPTQGVEEARRLVEVEGVHAIVGPLSSTVALAVSESVTRDAGVPVISPSATSPALSAADDGGFLFRSTISDAAQGVILADLAADEGYDNVAVMFINDAYGQGLADAFEAAFGGTVTKSSFEDGQASYLAELQSVAGDGAQVLVAVGFPTQAQVFIREALENDIFDQFLFVDGTKSQELIDAIGGEFLGGFQGHRAGQRARDAVRRRLGRRLPGSARRTAGAPLRARGLRRHHRHRAGGPARGLDRRDGDPGRVGPGGQPGRGDDHPGRGQHRIGAECREQRRRRELRGRRYQP